MSQISMAEVTKLRHMTSAGMMDCKKALEEANGDFEKAIEIIRKRGQMVASKRADRSASEGVVLSGIANDSKFGVLLSLNCETDFVAKNQDFISFAKSILDLALSKDPVDINSLSNLQIDGRTLSEQISEKIGVIGEKIELSYYDSLKAEKIVCYIHPGNGLAVLAGFNKSGLNEQVYRDIAMQVAAMNPVAIDREDVPADKLEKEKELGREKARTEGKPENMIEKIAEGMLNKYFKENTLLNQEFIKDGKKTVKQYLQDIDKELKVTGFKRCALKD